MGKRVHNFNPGPAALPLPVLEEIRDEFLDFRGTGMSVIEVSHRSKQFASWVMIFTSSSSREGRAFSSPWFP
jgi:phosphoserine aminotransferase